MFRFLVVAAFLFAGFGIASGQDGNYPLDHFTPDLQQAEYFPHEMIQDRHGILFIACNKGVIRFDGRTWEHIQTPTSVFTIRLYGDKIYTAGPYGFGILQRGESKTWEYNPLHTPDSAARITQMLVSGGKLYGISETSVSVFDLTTRSYTATKTGLNEGIINFRGEVYLTQAGRSPIRMKDLTPDVNQDHPLKNLDIRFITRSPGGEDLLAGTAKGDFLLYNGQFTPIRWKSKDPEDIEYLRESEITRAAWVSDTLVALSSLKGGVIFIQPFKGTIAHILNAKNGLPDNEIYGMTADNTKSVWVAHSKGLSRISPYLPFRTFDRFPGLEGNILSVTRHNGRLYVGTTDGLFYLSRLENIKNIPVNIHAGQAERQKKGFFSKIWPFKKKSASHEKFRRELQSVEYVFERVKGISSKVFQLSSVNSTLYSAGLDGVFEINEEKSKQLLEVPSRYFHYSPLRNRIFLSSYEGELYSLDPETRKPVRHTINDEGQPVYYLFEDGKGTLFICGVNTLYSISGRHSFKVEERGHIQNPYYDETFGYVRGDTVFFLHQNVAGAPSGTYYLKENNLIRLDNSGVEKIIPASNGLLWILDEHGWQKTGQERQGTIPQLSIVKNATYLANDMPGKGIWIVTSNNELIYLDKIRDHSYLSPHSAFLYEVYTGENVVNLSEELRFDQEEGELTFRYSQAEFTGLLDIEYQYYVDGLSENWSNWSNENHEINFSYLPAGNYTLHVRSRNTLGEQETLAPVYFKVLAPYWKRPWFYLLEFAFIGLMLLISVRMKAMGYKYRLMSRLLALLTLIVIIELIQILAESKFETETSPVVDFIIQVVIAIIILPVEEILRKYIFKEKHVKVSDLFVLREQQRRKRRQVALKSITESLEE